MLYRLRVGCPWRDLPLYFGRWNSIYKRFNEWSAKGKLMQVFHHLVHEPDLEWGFIDGSIVKAHQHSASSDSQAQSIGDSVCGKTTKIHMLSDAFGLPVFFHLTAGQVHDIKVAPLLVKQLSQGQYLIADKGYDCELLRQQIKQQNMRPLIPRKKNSIIGNHDMDWHLYKHRHLVENLFARLKQFRSIATRYDKLERNYLSTLALACAFLWLPM
jgi:transposase